MRLLTIGFAVFVLSACVSNPAQDKAWQEALQSLAKAHEHVLQSLDSARHREAQLASETLALQREVERLGREVEEMNAEIEALHAKADAATTPSVAPSADHADSPATKRTPAPSTYTTTTRTSGTARASYSDRSSPPLTFTPRVKSSTRHIEPLAKTRSKSELTRTPRQRASKSDVLY